MTDSFPSVRFCPRQLLLRGSTSETKADTLPPGSG